jgi:predicted Zn-ribbon and HTH transcriptional regulator
MSSYVALPYIVLGAVMLRALLVRAQVVPPSCRTCGMAYERRELGQPVCRCR